MDDLCGARDPSETAIYFYCTEPAGHGAGLDTVTHRTEYRVADPDNPPNTLPAVHEWTETVAA